MRQRISIDEEWRFHKGDSPECAVRLAYDQFTGWPAPEPGISVQAMKGWVLPCANAFVKDEARRFTRPDGEPGPEIAYASPDFDDAAWEPVDLPHDWAIAGPFTAEGGGGMGRLPSAGVGWYRKKLDIPAADAGKSVFLDVDGAMSYAMVWVNGRFAGGWPFGYASWRLDLTPFLAPGGVNQLAIRLDNPPHSSRWYPGGGLYRHVWLVKTAPVHVGQWGTRLTTPEVSPSSAAVALQVTVDNDSGERADVRVASEIFELDAHGCRKGRAVAAIEPMDLSIPPRGSAVAAGRADIAKPKLWGPPPTQYPHRYAAVTMVWQGDQVLDRYETIFGIRTLAFDPDKGFFINGEHIALQGTCNHHDLGALGAALNERALRRQLETLKEMGCNALRTSHNPPAPELLDMADEMGLLVLDEAFDVWEREKAPLDFHLIFPDWHEPDLRAFMRRDFNHPSVIMWGVGNEVVEQTAGEEGAAWAARLTAIAHEEDPTRPSIAGMNFAKPDSPMSAVLDAVGLNYQGEGVRGAPGLYPAFHDRFPAKFIVGTETASAVSSRGVYLFPVAADVWATVGDGSGLDRERRQVSAYELYAMDYSASADRVFASLARHPYVGGEFVWTGWDYLGEPVPFDSSRSSYFGIIDLAGFRKDRFYLYQSHWRADFPMAHILPHWTWPERIGRETPVHVFTSGDEAELFLNGRSLGRKKKGECEYRLRWDDVVYAPGVLTAVAYRKGGRWAAAEMKTSGVPAALALRPDRRTIDADGRDLSFVTIAVTDRRGLTSPRADHRLRFSIDGPGEIAAADNGDPTGFESFLSPERRAFNGLCLVVVRGQAGRPGKIRLTAAADGLKTGSAVIKSVSGGR